MPLTTHALLTDEQRARINAIRLYRTRYEAVIERADGEKRLLAYLRRKSRDGLRDVLRQRSAAALAFLNCDEALMKDEEDCISLGTGMSARFSGRTQRDAIMEGELPYVGSMEQKATS